MPQDWRPPRYNGDLVRDLTHGDNKAPHSQRVRSTFRYHPRLVVRFLLLVRSLRHDLVARWPIRRIHESHISAGEEIEQVVASWVQGDLRITTKVQNAAQTEPCGCKRSGPRVIRLDCAAGDDSVGAGFLRRRKVELELAHLIA